MPYWNADPKNAAEWKDFVDKAAAPVLAALPAIRERLGVTSEPVTIAGVKAYVVQPRVVPAANLGRVLLHFHGGSYVLSPGKAGKAGTREAVMIAAYVGFRVVSVDYRMPPDPPYPAAMDDAMAVYRELIKMTDPKRMAVFGTSMDGGMALALVAGPLRRSRNGPAGSGGGSRTLAAGGVISTCVGVDFLPAVTRSVNGWVAAACLDAKYAVLVAEPSAVLRCPARCAPTPGASGAGESFPHPFCPIRACPAPRRLGFVLWNAAAAPANVCRPLLLH